MKIRKISQVFLGLDYAEFIGAVVGGRKNVTSSQNNVMPAFADNKNVMCGRRRKPVVP